MRKLVETNFVSLDGVIDDTIPSTAPHASPEKWGAPYWDDQHSKYEHGLLFAADALLLGRVTYEGFAQAWPSATGDHADRMNRLPKYVASTTLQQTKWNATIIEGDIAEQVAKLKQLPGPNLLKFGTGTLDRTLMQHNLVDECHFWVDPVVLRSGLPLFEGNRFHPPEPRQHDEVRLGHRGPRLRPTSVTRGRDVIDSRGAVPERDWRR